jgi:hypothetical protein
VDVGINYLVGHHRMLAARDGNRHHCSWYPLLFGIHCRLASTVDSAIADTMTNIRALATLYV